MDTAYRRRPGGGGSRTARRSRGQAGKRPPGRERRRLAQLVMSLILFLLVFVGRGVFPRQLEAWKQLSAADVDFKAVFQQFGQAISEGEPLQAAFEDLCVAVFGGEVTGTDPAEGVLTPPEKVLLLGQTADRGMSYASEHGLAPGLSAGGGEPDPEPVLETEAPETESPEPEPTAEAVTAVAQAYSDDGEALPSNVSFAYYDLGLTEVTDPVDGSVTSGFGYRTDPISGEKEFHLGLDIGAAEGTPIGAFAGGTVEYIGESDVFGMYLKIDHGNNVSSFYAHCSKLLVHKGDTVTCGETVALVGQTGYATGPHLHLIIIKDGVRLDPAYYVCLD